MITRSPPPENVVFDGVGSVGRSEVLFLVGCWFGYSSLVEVTWCALLHGQAGEGVGKGRERHKLLNL